MGTTAGRALSTADRVILVGVPCRSRSETLVMKGYTHQTFLRRPQQLRHVLHQTTSPILLQNVDRVVSELRSISELDTKVTKRRLKVNRNAGMIWISTGLKRVFENLLIDMKEGFYRQAREPSLIHLELVQRPVRH
jgi:hypothetical protein